jgi:hypothetical protein
VYHYGPVVEVTEYKYYCVRTPRKNLNKASLALYQEVAVGYTHIGSAIRVSRYFVWRSRTLVRRLRVGARAHGPIGTYQTRRYTFYDSIFRHKY